MEQNEIRSDFSTVNKWIYDILADLGMPEQWIVYTKITILLIITIIGVYLLHFLVRRILTFIFQKISKTISFDFFKYAIKNRVPHFLALIVPYTFVINSIPFIFEDFKGLISPLIKLTDVYMVFMVIWTVMSFIRTGADVIQKKSAFKQRPFNSYLQVIQIILFIFGLVVIYSIFTGKSATGFFAAMGAASAILMLMFKDTIMGFVASIQLSTNNMLKIGDWITMNKYGADGTVEEINLTTVKVANFDKTITTIPTYALISDSFQNWRGMQESGGRRFTRSLYIMQADIRFMTDEELEELKKMEGLSEYITEKQAIHKELNEKLKITSSSPLLGHKLTNNDLFMEYAKWFLRTHPEINKNLALLVRQLPPTAQGLPIQLYTFTNTTIWSEYEDILSEIINHFVSVVKYFDLRIFELTAGSDKYDVSIRQQQDSK